MFIFFMISTITKPSTNVKHHAKLRLHMKNYLKLLKFLKGHQKRFAVAIVFIIFSSMFEGVQLSFILPVVDRIFTNKKIILHSNLVPGFINHLIDYLNTTDVYTLFWMTPLCFIIL